MEIPNGKDQKCLSRIVLEYTNKFKFLVIQNFYWVNVQANMRNKQISSAPDDDFVGFTVLVCCVAAKYT